LINKDLRFFDELIPKELKDNMISLEPYGSPEYLWNWRDVLKVIDILVSKKKMILGGDLYYYLDGRHKPTGDSWYTDPENESYITMDDILRSQKRSIDYINLIVSRNGDNFYYSLVVDFDTPVKE
jgi:hypothetical protein